MEEIQSAYRSISPRIIRDRIQIGSVVALVVVLIAVLVVVSTALIRTKQTKNELYRTEKELIDGGKRFLEYFYSLNSRSVDDHQYFAIAMIGDELKSQERSDYLAKTDFIRRVQEAKMTSYIDWSQTTIRTLTKDQIKQQVERGYFKDWAAETTVVDYKGELVVNDRVRRQWNMILFLFPAEFTNENPTGVSVVTYIDVASTPLI